MGRSFIILILLFHSVSSCQSLYNPGARQISMANSDAASGCDVFSLFNNPAGLSQIRWREIGVFYSPAPFGFPELAHAYFAYNEPFSFGSAAAGGMTYGFDLYRESKFLIGFAFNYNNFSAGAVFNLHKVKIKNYGEDPAYYLDIGSLIRLTEEISLGFSFHNINRASFGKEENQIPVVINSGISYTGIPGLRINTALEKDINYNPSLLFGINYDLIEYFSLRTGFSNEPPRYTAGAGINYNNLSFDYAVFTHQVLGITHQAGIIINFGKKI